MSKVSAIMIFVLGLTLLIIGIPLGMFKEEVTRYEYYSGGILGNIRIPVGVEEVYPYQPLAVLLMLIGFILVITGIYLAKKDNSTSKDAPEEISFIPNPSF